MTETLVREPPLPGVSLEPSFLLEAPDTLPADGRRKKLDQYFTPPALAEAAVGWLVRDGYAWSGPGWDGMAALEPSAGRGAWIDALLKAVPDASCAALDIDPERVGDLQRRGIDAEVGDFLTAELFSAYTHGRYDLILGNPPYSGAEEHTRRALELRSRFGSVAFLLRLAFLESAERVGFWKEHPASKIYVLSERPSFSGGGTDNSAYGFFVWSTWHRGPTQTEVVQWKKPRDT